MLRLGTLHVQQLQHPGCKVHKAQTAPLRFLEVYKNPNSSCYLGKKVLINVLIKVTRQIAKKMKVPNSELFAEVPTALAQACDYDARRGGGEVDRSTEKVMSRNDRWGVW